MKLKIKDIKKFKNIVFGADSLLLYYPELLTDGVEVYIKDDMYYIVGGSDSTFFSELEVQFTLEIV